MNNDPFGQGPDLFEPDPERPVLDATFEDFFHRNKTLFFKIALNRLGGPATPTKRSATPPW
ncbi:MULTISPECIES: hypothetical protein [unclassified Streptomyces]|uniref:hypothetical protein n=1 Tax=unclassified Streptomyces TaxID=2593676 RepID=UPI001654EF53|nr:hypothetical protein [Streptomyces sp. CB02980]MCB8900838.1 hypothetical protein [Streptomyces sp. CB02980]